MHYASVNSSCPHPTGYCGAFARLISNGGGAFANFAPPGGRTFICQPRGYSRVFDTHAVSYQNTLNIPRAYIFKRPFLKGLFLERLIFKVDWASPIVGRKFTVLALFYFVFEGNFPSISPRGAYIRRGDLTEGFLRGGGAGGAATTIR